MANFTHFAENMIADAWRWQPLVLADDWTIHILTAVDKASHTKAAGTGYAPVTRTRGLAEWCGTQAVGSTLPSTGATHKTSNNGLIDFGTIGAGGWGGPMVGVGLFSGANLFCWADTASIALTAGEQIMFAAGELEFTVGVGNGVSNHLANMLIDSIFRGETLNIPVASWAAYTTTAPSNAGGGAEPNVGGYVRVAIPNSMTGWGPTQGDQSEDPSSGTSGRISNSVEVVFPEPTAYQGAAGWVKLMDSELGGNLLLWKPLPSPKSIIAGGPAPRFEIDGLGINIL